MFNDRPRWFNDPASYIADWHENVYGAWDYEGWQLFITGRHLLTRKKRRLSFFFISFNTFLDMLDIRLNSRVCTQYPRPRPVWVDFLTKESSSLNCSPFLRPIWIEAFKYVMPRLAKCCYNSTQVLIDYWLVWFNPSVDKGVPELVCDMLKADCRQRPTIQEVLSAAEKLLL